MMSIFQQNSKLFHLLFWGSFVFFIIVGIWAFSENHMPVVGVFWTGFVALAYWLIGTKKIRTGIARGFIFGVLIDFILLFTLHKLHPEEDIAGIVIISLVLSGLFFGFIGYLVEKYFWKKD